jgi:hypothetical protein
MTVFFGFGICEKMFGYVLCLGVQLDCDCFLDVFDFFKRRAQGLENCRTHFLGFAVNFLGKSIIILGLDSFLGF